MSSGKANILLAVQYLAAECNRAQPLTGLKMRLMSPPTSQNKLMRGFQAGLKKVLRAAAALKVRGGVGV